MSYKQMIDAEIYDDDNLDEYDENNDDYDDIDGDGDEV